MHTSSNSELFINHWHHLNEDQWYYPTYGSPMPMRRNLVQCSLVYDTTISNIYALNDTFNGSGNTGSFTGTVGTTLANPSGNELEVSSTTVYPVISATISTVSGKEYMVSADLNGMTLSGGYTGSVLSEIIEGGVTVASQSVSAPGNFNFTYTAGAGSASNSYTYVLTPNPGPPPPPPTAPFNFNLDNALVYYLDTNISSNTVCVSKNGYRYGFNGKRIDENEEGMGGGGSTYDYGFRIYNPGLGRFLSVDPLSSEYAWYTPFQFAGNSLLIAIDLDGLEEYIVITWWCNQDKSYHTKIKVIKDDGPLIVHYYTRVFYNPNLTFAQQVEATDGFEDHSNGVRKESDYNVDEKDKVWMSNEQKSNAEELLKVRKTNKLIVGIDFKEATGYQIIEHVYNWSYSCTNYASVAKLLEDPMRTVYSCKANDITRHRLRLDIEVRTKEEKEQIEKKFSGYKNVILNIKVNPKITPGRAIIKSYRRTHTKWVTRYNIKRIV